MHRNKLHEKVLKQTNKQKDPSLIHKWLCEHSFLPGETLGQGCPGPWPSSSCSSPSRLWPTLLPTPHHGYFCVSYLVCQWQRSLKLEISHCPEFSLSWTYMPVLTQLCPTLWNPMDCHPSGSSVYGNLPGENTGVGCHFLLQGIFPAKDRTRLSGGSCTGRWKLTTAPPGKSHLRGTFSLI